MDGAESSRWRKALVISFVLHSIVLTSVGWMAGKAFMPVALQETLIELELLNEPDSGQASVVAEQHSSGGSETIRNLQQPVSNDVVANEAAAEPVVVVGGMAGESVDTGTVSSVSIGVSGGGNLTGGTSSGEGANAGSGIVRSRDIIPPGILVRREPAYPEQARRAGIEGTVVLSIEILQNGRAGDVSVSHSSGSELLDAAAMEAVQRWRFVPAKVSRTGESIVCQTTMPVIFKLKG
jgi:protein TonB